MNLIRSLIFVAVLWMSAAIARADAPSTQPADDSETEIACSTAVKSVRAGNGNLAVDPGDYHYRVYLPPGYSKTADETFPCLFVFSAGGNARLGNVSEFVLARRWVVVLLVESKNGPLNPVIGNFLAAYDDAVKRFRIQPGMFFATGQSGGARSASLCVELRPGFGGLLLQAAGFWYPAGYKTTHSFSNVNPKLAVYALFGDTDMNRSEALSLRHDLPATTPYRWDIFTGGHQWAPVDAVEPALDWLDQQSVLHGATSTPMREYLIRRVKADLTAADAATATPWQRYQALEEAHQIIAARSLEKDAKLKSAIKDLDRRLTEAVAAPPVKRELEAAAPYDAVSTAEQLVRSKPSSTPDQLKAAATIAATDYKSVANQFPDSVAGRNAGRLAEYRGHETN